MTATFSNNQVTLYLKLPATNIFSVPTSIYSRLIRRLRDVFSVARTVLFWEHLSRRN